MALLATTGAAPPASVRDTLHVPPIVFVSRKPVAGDPRAIPGLGPHLRTVVTGGRLLIRERDGRLRELLPPGRFYDVSDPAISLSALRIAFAAVTHPDSAWRLWVVGVDGSDLRQVTFSDGFQFGPPRVELAGGGTRSYTRYDDIDPCWTSDSSLVFASTRFPQRAQYADLPVTNLYTTCLDLARGGWCPPSRITAERNGAEEPVLDAANGRVLFSRWWFNRYRAADTGEGITTNPAAAIARDTVNLWQVMTLSLADRRPQLAAGDLDSRRGTMGYQPSPLADGSIAAVYAANLGLSPRPGGTGIHALSRTFKPEHRLAGALVTARAGDAYGGTEGLAPPAACSPAGLADGRVLFSYDPGARGEVGLYVMQADGSGIERVVDLPGTLELDAAAIVARPNVPRQPPPAGDEREDPEAFARDLAAGRGDQALGSIQLESPSADRASFPGGQAMFRFHDLDVFADGPAGAPGHGAAPRTPGARLRFFATLARPDEVGGDSVFLVREVAVGGNGEVNERSLPADVPMFEQLVGADGRVLMTAHGPATVAGFNAGVAGTVTRCVGCHLGHSTLPLGTVATSGGGR